MSDIEITYDGSTLEYDIPPTKISLPQRAELGSISMGSLGIEDPAAALALVGHRPIYVEEGDCSQPRLFTGWVVERNIGRSVEQGQFVGSNARIHDTTIVDLNACFGFRVITGADGNRPAETIDARVAWLIASDYLTGLVDDTGKIASRGGDSLEPTDYRGQYPADVMSDVAGFTNEAANWFAFWDPAPATGIARPGLFFANVDATLNVSTISISNVLADIDNVTCFAPSQEARLERTPETVYSDVVLDYGSGGSVFRTLATTETAHIKRGTTISRPRTGRTATAIIQADNWLACHANEVDRLTPTIHVPSSVVGLLWAGQQMQVKFSHLSGYESWTTMRIVASTPRPVDDHASSYDVDLELVAARAAADISGSCSYALSADLTTPDVFGATYTPSTSAYHGSPAAYSTSSYTVSNTVGWIGGGVPGLNGTGNNGSLFGSTGIVWGTGGTWIYQFEWDLGEDPPPICTVLYHKTFGQNPSVVASNDRITWTEIVSAGAITDGTAIALVPPATYRYWALRETFVLVGGLGYMGDVTIACFMLWAATGGTTGGTIPPPPGTTTVATTNPTATDDSDHGYLLGVPWVNTTTGEAFVLVDNTVGAAVWTSTTAAAGITVDDEGTPLATAATTLDFVGTGVTASGTGATKTITIPGGVGRSFTFFGA